MEALHESSIPKLSIKMESIGKFCYTIVENFKRTEQDIRYETNHILQVT